MLCIIFTKQKLLAGAKLKETELLHIKGQKHIDLLAQPMAKVLERNMMSIVDSYEQYRKASGHASPAMIPTSVAFPVDAENNDSDKDREAVLEFLKPGQDNKLQLVHADNLPLSFVYGLDSYSDILSQPCVVLEALDEYLNLCYFNIEAKNGQIQNKDNGLNGKLTTNSQFNFVPLKTFGMASGRQNLMKELEKDFTDAGLLLDDADKVELRRQLLGTAKDRHINIEKKHGVVNIQAKVHLDKRRYEEAVSVNKISLASRLNQTKLDHLGVSKVILLGEYLDNTVLHEYFEQELKIGNKLVARDITSDPDAFKTIIDGLARKTQEILELRAEEERMRKEEEDRKRREVEDRRRREEEERKRREAERMAQISRDKLMYEIRVNCTDPSKQSEYEETYVPQGIQVGIPREVLIWNIQQAIQSAALDLPIEAPKIEEPEAVMQPTPATVTPGPSINPVSKATPTELSATENHEPPVAPPESPNTPPAQEQEAPSVESEKVEEVKPEDLIKSNGLGHAPDRSLEELFEIDGVLLDPEFITKKVTHIVTHDVKVIKILPAADIDNPDRKEAFEHLYQKELAYYQELSEIHQAKEGLYYFRNFIERNTLKDYVRKNGMDKKDGFDKLTSNDLKTILEVWREIKGLPVSHANLTEYNILVITKRKWNLQKETEIKMVGFTSEDCTPKDMEEQVHKIWSKLIGPDVYLDFRKKFKI